MGNQQQIASQQNAPHATKKSKDQKLKVTYHRHQNMAQLTRIFRFFNNQPYMYIYRIDVQVEQYNCCSHTVLKLTSPIHPYSLQTLLNAKRKTKGFFIQKQIWYIIKSIISIFAYMQSHGIVLGTFNPRMFNLENGRFIIPEVLHLLPANQHEKSISIHNYYSPQKLKSVSNDFIGTQKEQKIDLFKSQTFSFGLLLLQIGSCPSPRPKFQKTNMRQLLWNQIAGRYQIIRQRYSQKLCQLVQMSLREDVRTRPDWNYLRFWLAKNLNTIDVAPCIFWSV